MTVRKQIYFIYGTVACCSLSIVICGISLGTENWFTGVARASNASAVTDINYGLFKGSKTKAAVGIGKALDMAVVCTEGVCMFSCGVDGDARRKDIDDILRTGFWNDCVCDADLAEGGCQAASRADSSNKDGFLSFAFWLVTIAFLAIGIGFSALGGTLAIYNTFRTPIQPILSIFGLYVWNGIAAGSVLLGMIIWGSAHATTLRDNAAVSETIGGGRISEGEGKLGYSYWILILAVLLNLTSIGLIRFRSWKIAKMEQKTTQVIDEKMTNGDILLF